MKRLLTTNSVAAISYGNRSEETMPKPAPAHFDWTTCGFAEGQVYIRVLRPEEKLENYSIDNLFDWDMPWFGAFAARSDELIQVSDSKARLIASIRNTTAVLLSFH
jgi:hypothetical protein